MATKIRRFNTHINNTPCCVVVLNDGTLDVRAANGLPSEALAAAYQSASADERYRLQAEADAAVTRTTLVEWAGHAAAGKQERIK